MTLGDFLLISRGFLVGEFCSLTTLWILKVSCVSYDPAMRWMLFGGLRMSSEIPKRGADRHEKVIFYYVFSRIRFAFLWQRVHCVQPPVVHRWAETVIWVRKKGKCQCETGCIATLCRPWKLNTMMMKQHLCRGHSVFCVRTVDFWRHLGCCQALSSWLSSLKHHNPHTVINMYIKL